VRVRFPSPALIVVYEVASAFGSLLSILDFACFLARIPGTFEKPTQIEQAMFSIPALRCKYSFGILSFFESSSPITWEEDPPTNPFARIEKEYVLEAKIGQNW